MTDRDTLLRLIALIKLYFGPSDVSKLAVRQDIINLVDQVEDALIAEAEDLG